MYVFKSPARRLVVESLKHAKASGDQNQQEKSAGRRAEVTLCS